MPHERPSDEFDAQRDDSPEVADRDERKAPFGVNAESTGSEAERQAAQAKARAEAARARAERLHRQAEAIGLQEKVATVGQGTDGEVVHEEDEEFTASERQSAVISPHPWWRRRTGWKIIAEGAAILLICASLAASGYMYRHHRSVLEERHRAAEFSAAARQSVVTLMSIDARKAKEDMQRILDNSTGKFKDEMQKAADDFTKAVEQSKVSTIVTVKGVAVESMTDDSAAVLVAATSDRADPNKPQPPRSWRVYLTMKRVEGRLKMSNVEFLQ
jgi:Mce-associated membrane protein